MKRRPPTPGARSARLARALRGAALDGASVALSAWAALVAALAGAGPTASPARTALAVGLIGAVLFARVHRGRRAALAAAFGLACLASFYRGALRPSGERDWRPDHARQARATLAGPLVEFRDLRAFRWATPSAEGAEADFEAAWFDASYDARELAGIDFWIATISDFAGVAHTMVSFCFEDGRYLVLSVEARKQVGEDYGVWAGLMRQFELIYVLGDERDLVELRARLENPLRRVPVEAAHERQLAFFLDVVARANELAEKPEFYDTLSSNCTTNLARHWELAAGRELGFDHRVLLPGFADELALELGLVSAPSVAELRARTDVSARARAAVGDPDFSRRVRDAGE